MSSVAGIWLGRGWRVGNPLRPRKTGDQKTAHANLTATVDPLGAPGESGEYLLPGTRLFHDGDQRPPRISKSEDGEISLLTRDFDGSYVSLVAELDPASATQIAVGTDLVVKLDAVAAPAIPAFIRAHFSNEEGREVLHDLIVVEEGPREVRFNLDGLRIPVDLATIAWVDVIFSDATGTRLAFSRLTTEIEAQ